MNIVELANTYLSFLFFLSVSLKPSVLKWGDFCLSLQWTLDNVWRHFWLSLGKGGGTCYWLLVGRGQGCC